MDARPILLVRDPICADISMDELVVSRLQACGYFVLKAPPEAMDGMRILALCPFTNQDVDALRALKGQVHENEALLESIACRMEDMLR